LAGSTHIVARVAAYSWTHGLTLAAAFNGLRCAERAALILPPCCGSLSGRNVPQRITQHAGCCRGHLYGSGSRCGSRSGERRIHAGLRRAIARLGAQKARATSNRAARGFVPGFTKAPSGSLLLLVRSCCQYSLFSCVHAFTAWFGLCDLLPLLFFAGCVAGVNITRANAPRNTWFYRTVLRACACTACYFQLRCWFSVCRCVPFSF